MRIVFELEPADVDRFNEAVARAAARVACADDCEVVDAARHALDSLPIGEAPGYVRRQLVEVQRLIQMLEDEAWMLPPEERAQVLQALAYFGDPDDMIPDHIEVIGLLDDAIMLALILGRLAPMLDGYGEFCAFREALGPMPGDRDGRLAFAQRLAGERQRLHARIREVRDEAQSAGLVA